MTTRLRHSLAAVALIGALGLTGCTDGIRGTGDDRIGASATFDDVADLADGAPVMMADVTIGSVSSIQLDDTGRRAEVAFSVDESANVPAAVTAQVRRTSALGEKFIDLVPQTDDLDAEPLADGAVIKQTAVVSDLEQLIGSGTDAFTALSASQIAILLDEGERAFAGKGPQLATIIDHLSEVADGYQTRTEKVRAIITDLDRLAGDLAPQTGANGEALANLKETLRILNENDEAFYALVRSLNDVAEDGNRILARHLSDITTQVRGLRDVTDAVSDEQAALAGVLKNLSRHNQSVPLAERNNFIHVLIDVVLCGVPAGGDVPGDPVDACEPGRGVVITRRIVANLIVFFTLSAGLIVYGAVTLFGNPMEERRTVMADLPDAGGLRTGFSVSHDGVVIGTVSKIELHEHEVRVTAELDPGVTVPDGVAAKVVRASAVGEQRLDLVTTAAPSGRPLPDGAVVPLAEDPIPPDVADVLETTNRLLDALPADDLNVVVRELAASVDGRAADLKSINRSISDIDDDVVEVEPELRALLDSGPQVLDDFTAMSPAAHQALENTEILTRTLASRDEDLVDLVANAGDLATTFDRVLLDDRASLTCIIGDVRTVSAAVQGETLHHLDQGLAPNQLFFGAIDDVAVRGEAADVGYGPAQADALWLRSRLLIPPESPPGSRYSPPRGPRPVLTGEGCRNDYGTGAEAVPARPPRTPRSRPPPGRVRPFASSPAATPAPASPPAAPVDDSPGAEDRRTTYDVFILLIALAVLGGLGAKSYSYLRNRS